MPLADSYVTQYVDEYTDDDRPYQAVGAHLELLRSRNRVEVAEGPSDTGKSRCWFEKIHAMCEEYPELRCLYFREVRATCAQSGLVTYEKKVVPGGHPCLKGPTREHRRSYQYPNGSELAVGGLDDPEKLFSTEWDIIFGQEINQVLVEDNVAAFMRSLRNGKGPYHQLGLDLNPTFEDFWLYEWEADGRAHFTKFTHADNPSITEERLENLRQLRGTLRLRLLDGKRVAAVEGTYYGQLLREAKVNGHIKSGVYDPRLNVHVAMDLGVRDYQAIWWFQVDADGQRRYIDYFEYNGEGQGYYAMVLDDRKREHRYTYGQIILPHDANARQKGERVETPADTYREKGYNVVVLTPAPAIENQIEAARNEIPMCLFDLDACRLGLSRLGTYRRDLNIRTGLYGLPVHDRSSHAASAFQTSILGFQAERAPRKHKKVHAGRGYGGGLA